MISGSSGLIHALRMRLGSCRSHECSKEVSLSLRTAPGAVDLAEVDAVGAVEVLLALGAGASSRASPPHPTSVTSEATRNTEAVAAPDRPEKRERVEVD